MVDLLLRYIFLGIFIFSSNHLFSQDKVWKAFGHGQAEISSYEVTQPRYGQLRKGHEVFIYVPEPFKMDERIKPDYEGSVKKDNLIHVMKLNRYHTFLTGLYPYHVMTTIQSALYPKVDFSAFDVLNMNISAIEWCGNYFAQVIPDPAERNAKWEYNSYFEKEGRKSISIPLGKDVYFEDNLWIRIRELTGSFMKVGETKSVTIYERLWQNRISHQKLIGNKAILSKKDGKFDGYDAFEWSWELSGRSVTVFTDREYPHYILGWSDSLGGKGKRLAYLQTPYWEKNTIKDEVLRAKLKLP